MSRYNVQGIARRRRRGSGREKNRDWTKKKNKRKKKKKKKKKKKEKEKDGAIHRDFVSLRKGGGIHQRRRVRRWVFSKRRILLARLSSTRNQSNPND